jgi:predicted enzyme related to lactoylglutathione lyase
MNKEATVNIKKLSFQLLVGDLQRSIDFYTKKLGFDLDFVYEDFYAGIGKNGFSIHLKCAAPAPEERENKRSHNHLDIIISTEDIDALYETMLNQSIDIVEPLCDQPYGREFYIADPDGYIIALLSEK